MQFDLFDQGSDSQPGARQTDLEMMIKEKDMNQYEQKQEAKRARLEAAADRAEAKSRAAYKRADMSEEATGIPFGQPILVGHHSEARHRAAIRRADNAMRASIEADKRAGELRAKAAGVGSGGISADDPEAVQKLQAKIDAAQRTQDFMKAANKVVRRWAKKLPDGADSAGFEQYIAQLRDLRAEIPATVASDLLHPDFAGRIGFAAYQLQSNGANIKRMEARVASLRAAEARAAEAGESAASTEYEGVCTLVENHEENRLQLVFAGKPDAQVRRELKSWGFRWAPSAGAWQRQLNNGARYAAKRFLQSQGVEA